MKHKLPEFLTKPDPSVYKEGSCVILDFETTNIDYGDPLNPDNNIVLGCWRVVTPVGYYDNQVFGNELAFDELVKNIQETQFLVCQNAKFDLQWLKRCGLDLHDVLVYDTMVAQYVIYGNQKRSLDLDSLANFYGIDTKDSLVKTLIGAGNCPSKIPKKLLTAYCWGDVEATHQIMKAQLDHIERNHPAWLPVVYTRCLLTPVLADIEFNGMTLDKERVTEVRTEYLRELSKIEEDLHELAGGINFNSPKQKAEFLYDTLGFKELTNYKGEPIRSPSGKPKTDKDTMLSLKATTEKQKKVQELMRLQSKYSSALSKNLNFFYGVCKDYKGKFYGSFNQGTTSTHRLSASGRRLRFDSLGDTEAGCQFQNFPREFKRLFVAREDGRVIGEGDGSQLEFRTAGHLGRDPVIKQEILDEVDIHQFTADALTSAGEPTSRQDAKASTFRPLYGGSSGSPAVQAYCNAFKEKYRMLSDTQSGWAREAANSKRLETEWGMVYYFPEAEVAKSGYIIGSTKVYNFPIQAFATAEIIPIALVYFWHMTRGMDILVINTVHDSIIVDMPIEMVNDFCRIVSTAMTKCVLKYLKKVYGIDFYVPLGCGIKIGTHWNEGDERIAEEAFGAMSEEGLFERIRLDSPEIKVDHIPYGETK